MKCSAFDADLFRRADQYRGSVRQPADAAATGYCVLLVLCKNVWIERSFAFPHPVDGASEFDGQQRGGACLVVFLFDAFGEGFGIGLRKEDADLRVLFDEAIDAIMADGTYDAIRAGYFPFDVR